MRKIGCEDERARRWMSECRRANVSEVRRQEGDSDGSPRPPPSSLDPSAKSSRRRRTLLVHDNQHSPRPPHSIALTSILPLPLLPLLADPSPRTALIHMSLPLLRSQRIQILLTNGTLEHSRSVAIETLPQVRLSILGGEVGEGYFAGWAMGEVGEAC